jgi:hypothetical protein
MDFAPLLHTSFIYVFRVRAKCRRRKFKYKALAVPTRSLNNICIVSSFLVIECNNFLQILKYASHALKNDMDADTVSYQEVLQGLCVRWK